MLNVFLYLFWMCLRSTRGTRTLCSDTYTLTPGTFRRSLGCSFPSSTPWSWIPIPWAVFLSAYVHDPDTLPLLLSLSSSTRREFSVFSLPLPFSPYRTPSFCILGQILYGICNSISCVLNYFDIHLIVLLLVFLLVARPQAYFTPKGVLLSTSSP